ncbi:MAG: hypothetical protein LVQ97_02450 [Candidatus Micrarchaeales archaeon]|jgi:CYTH domain-containing protein|uniref:CYTH domain-containing protein n=1 Tax=Candidatus Micrarchaeum acidiphilum ARMAN-2 TaxID=425595 RepID=C7DIJ3_MICA2|nr:MAG: hypothetical protein UNLARM2_0881 [Candidatus Micrarchaeum acidiphilum ARMAN-2]MCW6161022.1 hypothetical protein [Candidatus Micrarchaeales archaeon]
MVDSIELERTFLIKYIPEGLNDCDHEEMLDIYIPRSSSHPHIRIRKAGNRYEITKKEPVLGRDSSKQLEQTIRLTKEEYDEFALLEGKRVHKTRYFYPYEGMRAEIDVFSGSLKGLILVDFEFKNENGMQSFEIPEFCLADVTQEEFLAGGTLCGKSYSDIEDRLNRLGYAKIRFGVKP